MAIQMRRGDMANYDENKMLPGEFGVALDEEELYITWGTGNSEKVLTEKDMESPNFSGEPSAPTAPVGTDTTQIATTEFVRNEIAANTNQSLITTGDGTVTLSLGGEIHTQTLIATGDGEVRFSLRNVT